MKTNLPIKEMPRERFERVGKESLLTEELLAIILKTGSKNTSVNDLSRKIIKDLKTIKDLKKHTIKSLMQYDGIGKTKAIEIISAIELGLRIQQDKEYKAIIKLNSAEKIFNYIKDNYTEQKQELFYCIYVDTNKNLISKTLLFKGSLNQSIVHPREIFKEAYLHSSSGIICVHNHPSGSIKPSKEDILTTNKIVETSKVLGIKLIDHIIIGNNNYYSFYENSLI
jgi:DNA repair protein RadC